jgi:hypothetical protein
LLDGIIVTLTKGNFDPSGYVIHECTYEGILSKFKPGDSTEVIEFTQTGFNPISSRAGRNHELPAYTIENAGINILLNSLSLPTVEAFYVPGLSTASHQRAMEIVKRAYRLDWVLPSSLDMLDENP